MKNQQKIAKSRKLRVMVWDSNKKNQVNRMQSEAYLKAYGTLSPQI